MSEQVNDSGPIYRASHDEDQRMDAGTMRILVIMGLGGIAILGGIAAYSMSGRGNSGGAVPVVQADTRQIRFKPDNAGGMAVAVEQKQADPNQSRLAPPPEEPRPLASNGPSGRESVPSSAFMQPRPRSVTVQFATAKSEAEAQATWDRLAKKMPDVIGQRRPLFQRVAEAGATPWRLRTSGFADPGRAKAFCDQVKAKGGTCTLVDS